MQQENSMKKNADGKIKNIVCISDLHAGCRLALCPPTGAAMDGGGRYTPSSLQLKLWSIWQEFWEWVPVATKGEPFAVVVNGDSLDGVHHNSTTQISHDLEDQADIAFEILQPVVELCQGNFYMVRGTDAHVGQSGVDEEKLAKRLGAKKNEVGQRARFELWLEVGTPPRLVHFAHHIGTSGSMAYETTALKKELAEMLADCALWRKPAPDVIVRSHRHRNVKVSGPSANGEAIGIITPGWQLRTPFSYRIPGGRVALPHIGGIVVRYGDREMFTEQFVRPISRPPSVVL
jgi:hypothetical protein